VRTVLTYGAIPNDGIDDLVAFQAALNDNVNANRILYVPNGTYNISGRLNWGGIGLGGFFTMQGESKEGVILRLNDNAVGFDNTAAPRAFIDAYEGNTANQFRNYLRDVTIDTGANNVGAIGLEFQANNTGRIENVTIRTSDAQKRGVTGLNQGFEFPGPLLMRNITIDGFDTGYVGAPQEYSAIFENLTLRNQRVRGIYVWRLPLQIRNLVSQNSVPVLLNDTNPGAWGHVVIDGGIFTGGSSAVDAITNLNSAGLMVIRNVTTNGYRNAINDQSFSIPAPQLVPDGLVTQFITDPVSTLNPSPTAILNLPVEETPDAPNIPVAQWASVKTFGAIENDAFDDTVAVQAALNSGASVVYFPSGQYVISDTLTVGPSVQRIEGLMSNITTNAPLATEERPLLRITQGSQAIVHISGLNSSFSSNGFRGGGTWIEHATANTVVVRDGDISYRNTVSGGKVFLENVVGNDMVFVGQRVWARQLNPEGFDITNITNDGGDFYVLGLKTEGNGTVLQTRYGGRSVVMGGLIYPATAIADRTRPMFINVESSVSISVPESAYADPNNAFAVWFRETRNGVTTDFTRSMLLFGRGHSNLGGQIALFNGYQTDTTAPSTPTNIAVVDASMKAIALSWDASSDAQSDIARYNIYRDGVFLRSVMPGGGTGYSDEGLTDGTAYSYQVSAINGAGLESPRSEDASNSTIADQTPPRLIAATVGLDPRTITLDFSEPLDPASANTLANYSVRRGGATVLVTSVALSNVNSRVTLTTAAMTPGTQQITINNVLDRASMPNAIAAGTHAAVQLASTGSGTGLTGRYYLSRNFIGSPILTRVDPQVNFSYGLGGPGGGVPVDGFAVQWSGQLKPRFNEDYTLFVRSDDGSRLFIDGVLRVNNWADQGPTERSTTLRLDSSRTHDIVVEYYENSSGAEVQLSWQSASQPKEVIPQVYLIPTPRLTTVRTNQGVGADIDLNRFFPGPGTGDNMRAFHSPASGGFHSASYWRFDLSSFNLANNFVAEATGTLSQTFFGVGDGRRLINVFSVRNSANGDNWNETGPGFVNWNTAVGNNNFGGIANPVTSRFASTFLLDNSSFNLNNQPDKTFFTGSRLADAINEDTDGRLTFLAKRFEASNDGQSWFSKEWGLPTFAPALKARLLPKCPTILSQPTTVEAECGQSATLLAVVQGQLPLTYQWLLDGSTLMEGQGSGSGQGAFLTGTNGIIFADAIGSIDGAWPLALSISNLRGVDAGEYTLAVTNACGEVTTIGVSFTPSNLNDLACSACPVCPADYNQDGGVTGDDIAAFFADYEAGTGCADTNVDGGITGDDIAAFFVAYEAGGC